MSSDTGKYAPESLTELIDALERATENAGKGEQTAVEKSLQLMGLLKQIKVNTEILVATQGGKRVRKLTKHKDMNIKAAAAELVNTWKGIVAAEAATVEKGKEQLEGERINAGGLQPADAVVSPGVSYQGTANNGGFGHDSERANKRQKVEAEAMPVKREPPSISKTGVEARDKIRLQLAEALQLAAADVPEGDAGVRAADIEEAVLKQNGGINPKYKAKIRSIWVNLKDSKNPDFRRSVLLGEITGEEAVNLKPEEMASKARQEENQRIREAAMFEAQRGKKRLATTDQFHCSKCKKRQTSYYQMQTRSADEPMTTFVICQNCDNRWKFC